MEKTICVMWVKRASKVSPKPQDFLERRLALSPATSWIVQAPAGSGKTTLLVARYLTLLAQVNNPEEILAITFTRKAAHEMRSRIVNALKQALIDDISAATQEATSIPKLALLVLKQDQIKQWNIIQNPNRLRIQTIDAFCYYLAKQAPIFSNFNPQCRIIHNQEAEIYYSQAAIAVLKNLSDHQYVAPLSALLLHLDNDWDRTEKLFIEMLKSREQWLPHIVGLKSVQARRRKMERALQEIADENIERSANLFPKELHQELTTLLKISQDNSDHDTALISFQEIISQTDLLTVSLATWQNLAQILLTKECSWRQKVTKKQGFPAPNPKDHKAKQTLMKTNKSRMEELLVKFSEHEHLRQSLENLLLSPPSNYSNDEWKIIEALLELLPLLVAHLKVIFDENLVTDHAEISMAAQRVLGQQDEPSDLALNLDYRLQHLLIDEFQDTSLPQYRLLEKLITAWQPHDGRTIFIVGDPMQSIYRFREAEVGLFLRVQRYGIGNLKPQPLTLATNFRSTKNIIDWLNLNFTKIMPTLADISLGAVPFCKATASFNHQDSEVKITLRSEADEELEAKCVVTTIQKILQKNSNDTLAILVKARKHLQKIIPHLRQAHLEFQACELETLQNNLVIRDLYSLTRALFDLTDSIAWIAILRAPWCGLALQDLHTIATAKEQLIWDKVNSDQDLNLSLDAKTRLMKFRTLLAPILEERGRITWRELITKAWLAIGGPATVPSELELEYAASYFELFTEPLDLLLLQKKLAALYPPPTTTARIQLMTIHKAKGLEFDHVIIPGTNRATRVDEHKLMLWFERPKLHQGSDLLVAPITASGSENGGVYRYLQTVEQKKEFYETGRLLYVAMTRAKKSVHLLGQITNSQDSKKPYAVTAGSLLEQLEPCFTAAWIQEKPIKIKTDTLTPMPSPTTLVRLSNTWRSPLTIDLPQYLNCPNFEVIDPKATTIGTIIHQCFRQISASNLDDWTDDYLTKQEPYWQRLLQQAGCLASAQELEIIHNAIKITLSDQRGRWILGQHQNASSELAITTKINDEVAHYVIDRTFIDEDGILWIIDYKTSKPHDKNYKVFLDQEAAKYSSQLQQYAKAMSSLEPKRSIRLGLYFPMFAGWIVV